MPAGRRQVRRTRACMLEAGMRAGRPSYLAFGPVPAIRSDSFPLFLHEPRRQPLACRIRQLQHIGTRCQVLHIPFRVHPLRGGAGE